MAHLLVGRGSMEHKFNAKILVSNVIVGTLYIMLALISFGIVLDIAAKHFGLVLGIAATDLFYVACIVVCASPFVSAIVFIVGYVMNRNYKATLLGLLLLMSLSTSLIYAVMG